jgi:hypothetical protein
MFNTKFLAILCRFSAIFLMVACVLWAFDTLWAMPPASSFSAGLGYSIGMIAVSISFGSIFYIAFACAHKYLVEKK